MIDFELLFFDEFMVFFDFGFCEELLVLFSGYVFVLIILVMFMVMYYVEEIFVGFMYVMLICDGLVVVVGFLVEMFIVEVFGEIFGMLIIFISEDGWYVVCVVF